MAAVCKRGRNRCKRCGKDGCSEEDCELTKEQAVCLYCESNHEVGAKKCQRRIMECEVERTRATNKMSYAEATRRVREGHGTGRKEQDRPGVVEKQQRKSDSESLIMDIQWNMLSVYIVGVTMKLVQSNVREGLQNLKLKGQE